MILAPTDDSVWIALLQKQRLYLIPAVYKELTNWLKDPRGINLTAHAILSLIAADAKDLPIVPFNLPSDTVTRRVFVYYVNLLAMRKRILPVMREQYRERFGREPNNQDLSN